MNHDLILPTVIAVNPADTPKYWLNITTYCAKVARENRKEHLGNVILADVLDRFRARYMPNNTFYARGHILFLDLEGKIEFLLTWDF